MKWRTWFPWLLLLVLGLAGLWQHVVENSASAERLTGEYHPDGRMDSRSEPATSSLPALPNTAVLGMHHSTAPLPDDRLAEMMRRDLEGLSVTSHPDGRRSIHLGGRFQHVTRVLAAADGSQLIRCFSSHEELSDKTPVTEPDTTHVPETADF